MISKDRLLRFYLIPILIFAAFSFSLGFAYQYHLPRIKAWILVEVESKSRQYLPVRIWPKAADISFFPLGIELHKVRLLPQKDLKPLLAPTEVELARVSISIFGLLKGQLRVGELYLKHADVKYFEPEKTPRGSGKKANSKAKSQLRQIFELPIDDIVLEDINLWAKLRQPTLGVRVKSLDLSIENSYRALLVNIDTPSIQVKKLQTDPIFDIALNSKLLVRENRVQLSSLKAKKQESYLVASGTLYGDITQLEFSNADLNTRTHISLPEIRRIFSEFYPEVALPKLKGIAEIDLQVEHVPSKPLKVKYAIGGRNLKVDEFVIGKVNTSGVINKNSIDISKFSISNSAGAARIDQGLVSFNLQEIIKTKNLSSGLKLQGNVTTKKLSLRKLLANLNVGDVPVELSLKGDLPCYGEVTPQFKIKCQGTVWGQNLSVWSESEDKNTSDVTKFPIVDLKTMQADGWVEVNSSAVSYKADLKVDNSTGSSDGSVDYKKGFNINYQGNIRSLKSVQNLANLSLEGSTKVSGKTYGDSDHGIIDMTLNSKDVWLEDYQLGKFKTRLRYRKGLLSFKNIHGQLGSSPYKGSVSLNLFRKTIFLSINSPFIDIEDGLSAFSRKVTLPFNSAGTGTAKVRAWGPLQFNKLSYNLESKLFRGFVAKESFDKLTFNVKSKDGYVKSDVVEITKSRSVLRMRGTVDPNGQMDSVVIAKDLRLEQSEHVDMLGLNLAGKLDATASLKGFILKPRVELNGRLSKVLVDDSPTKDSRFLIRLNPNQISGSANFIGDAIETKFNIPLREKLPLRFYLKTEKWDFAPLFSVFSGSASKKGFETEISSVIDLRSDTGEFWKSTGSASVSNFRIRRGNVEMASKAPMKIIVDNGVFNAKNFQIDGDGTFLSLEGSNNRKDSLNFSINGKIDLTLATLMTPFLDDLQGRLSFSTAVKGSSKSPQLLGSAYIQDGVVQLKGFPHPFSKVFADILFSENSLFVNSLKASLGGGPVRADGKISYESTRSVPVNIKGNFKNVSLNVPEGFGTFGDGDFYVKGTTFPYEIGVNYNVSKGDVNRDFSQTESSLQTVRPSDYLPKFLTEERFEPIHLNLNVNIPNPIPVNLSASNVQVKTPIKGRMTVQGPPEKPKLTGLITTQQPGQVIFRNNTFDIRNGQIEYNQESPENPSVNITAQTRINNEYDISLIVQGKAKDPKIDVSSSPPLAEHEIISLLALGITSEELENKTDSNLQAAQTSIQLGSALIKEQLGLGRQAKSNLGVEIDIGASYDTETQSTVPELTMRKQWTPKFGMSVKTAKQKELSNRFKAEYKVNKNLSVIGLFEQQSDDSEDSTTQQEVFGMDLEYKFEFK